VVHLAGYISVGESVRLPDKYWGNNLGAGASLLLACARHPVQAFLFSSTAAVYGNAEVSPIPEAVPLAPTSPYGDSKLAFGALAARQRIGARLSLRRAALLQRRRRDRRLARRRERTNPKSI
jgi:UDP-glucose 4-epimerase